MRSRIELYSDIELVQEPDIIVGPDAFGVWTNSMDACNISVGDVLEVNCLNVVFSAFVKSVEYSISVSKKWSSTVLLEIPQEDRLNKDLPSMYSELRDTGWKDVDGIVQPDYIESDEHRDIDDLSTVNTT